MLSIDQNSHSLWDALPKLQAMVRAGRPVSHYVEDVDVAFTAVGANDENHPLRLERERFYPSGGADWGAAMFYTCFLGRQPVDVRQWEPLTGLKTAALARRLGLTLEELYARYSPSDNYQLIGPSYAGGGLYHRTIADLRLDQTLEFLHQLMDLARRDMLERFPQEDSRRRVNDWFDREGRQVAQLVGRCASGRLVELYRLWLGQYLGDDVPIALASQLLAPRTDGPAQRLLGLFVRDYGQLANLYNQAIQAADVGLRPLNTGQGELPFFAVLRREGRQVRTGLFFQDGQVRIGDEAFSIRGDGSLDVAALERAGVSALAGKAVLLVVQVRLGPTGQPLVLPYHGSPYMGAAHHFVRLLRRRNLLAEGELAPVIRVRFGLLERLRELDTIIRLPPHLAAAMGREEVPARILGEAAADLQSQAARRLESLRSPRGRADWQQQAQPPLLDEIAALDTRRRELARRDPKSVAIRQVGREMKTLQVHLLSALVEQIDRDWQLARLDYYDSRGALLPWCVGLGGMEFYERVIASARTYEEPD